MTPETIQRIKTGAAMRNAAQRGTLIIIPSSMTSGDLYRLGVARLTNVSITGSNELLALPVMQRQPA